MSWWRRRREPVLLERGAVVRTEYPSRGEWVVRSIQWSQDEWSPGTRMAVEFVDRETYERFAKGAEQ